MDTRHPYLQRALVPGIDELDPGSDASAEQNPTLTGRPERHGTELAGLVAGSRGPGGLHGVAPGASIMPIRVAGSQPDAEGGVSVYGRSDQVLAGLEAAVDPNADGDAHDAARIALETGCPVIPVGQWGAHELLPPYSARPKLFPRKRVVMKAGDPVDLSDLLARPRSPEVVNETTRRIMAAVTALVAELRGETPPAEVFDPRKMGVRQIGNPHKTEREKKDNS